MKKIIFATIPMKANLEAQDYAAKNNLHLKGVAGPVKFSINAVLAETLRAGDEVKAVLLKTANANGSQDENARLFEEELRRVAGGTAVSFAFESMDLSFDESKLGCEKQLRAILSQMEEDCEIYADITYGPKLLPMILLCAMSFAERFFGANIKHIVYGKVLFANNKIVPNTQELFDVTSIYYLNGLAFSIEAKSGKEMLEMLDEFFAV